VAVLHKDRQNSLWGDGDQQEAYPDGRSLRVSSQKYYIDTDTEFITHLRLG